MAVNSSAWYIQKTKICPPLNFLHKNFWPFPSCSHDRSLLFCTYYSNAVYDRVHWLIWLYKALYTTAQKRRRKKEEESSKQATQKRHFHQQSLWGELNVSCPAEKESKKSPAVQCRPTDQPTYILYYRLQLSMTTLATLALSFGRSLWPAIRQQSKSVVVHGRVSLHWSE